MRILTFLHFPSDIGYRRSVYPLYKPLEQSFVVSNSIRSVIVKISCFKMVIFPCLVILHFKETSSAPRCSVLDKMFRCARLYVNQSGGGEIGPVYRASFRL